MSSNLDGDGSGIFPEISTMRYPLDLTAHADGHKTILLTPSRLKKPLRIARHSINQGENTYPPNRRSTFCCAASIERRGTLNQAFTPLPSSRLSVARTSINVHETPTRGNGLHPSAYYYTPFYQTPILRGNRVSMTPQKPVRSFTGCSNVGLAIVNNSIVGLESAIAQTSFDINTEIDIPPSVIALYPANTHKTSCLELAVKAGAAGIVAKLMECGADPTGQTSTGMTLLHSVFYPLPEDFDFEVSQKLRTPVHLPFDSFSRVSLRGNTPPSCAHTPGLQTSSPSNRSTRRFSGKCALIDSVSSGVYTNENVRAGIVDILCSVGIDLAGKDSLGRTSTDYARIWLATACDELANPCLTKPQKKSAQLIADAARILLTYEDFVKVYCIRPISRYIVLDGFVRNGFNLIPACLVRDAERVVNLRENADHVSAWPNLGFMNSAYASGTYACPRRAMSSIESTSAMFDFAGSPVSSIESGDPCGTRSSIPIPSHPNEAQVCGRSQEPGSNISRTKAHEAINTVEIDNPFTALSPEQIERVIAPSHARIELEQGGMYSDDYGAARTIRNSTDRAELRDVRGNYNENGQTNGQTEPALLCWSIADNEPHLPRAHGVDLFMHGELGSFAQKRLRSSSTVNTEKKSLRFLRDVLLSADHNFALIAILEYLGGKFSFRTDT